jgi:hypothetical protein
VQSVYQNGKNEQNDSVNTSDYKGKKQAFIAVRSILFPHSDPSLVRLVVS